MRISMQLPYFKYPNIADTVADIAQTAEAAGMYSFWVMDHFFQLGGEFLGPAEDEMLEAYTTLGYLAGVTSTIKLGALVTGAIYRNPGLLVKAVTTLDVLSKGRVYFGIGAGWYEREAVAFQFPFDNWTVRFEKLEDALQIAHQMWSDNDGEFEGKQFRMKETLSNPQPISQPHPPILLGGMGEKKTLRYVAQYGDACNLFLGAGMDVIEHKLGVLKGHCEDVGRDYDDLERTTLGTAFMGDYDTPEKIVEACKKLADIGITHTIWNMPDAQSLDNVKAFGDAIIPQVADL